jgi:hypothetical protein
MTQNDGELRGNVNILEPDCGVEPDRGQPIYEKDNKRKTPETCFDLIKQLLIVLLERKVNFTGDGVLLNIFCFVTDRDRDVALEKLVENRHLTTYIDRCKYKERRKRGLGYITNVELALKKLAPYFHPDGRKSYYENGVDSYPEDDDANFQDISECLGDLTSGWGGAHPFAKDESIKAPFTKKLIGLGLCFLAVMVSL